MWKLLITGSALLVWGDATAQETLCDKAKAVATKEGYTLQDKQQVQRNKLVTYREYSTSKGYTFNKRIKCWVKLILYKTVDGHDPAALGLKMDNILIHCYGPAADFKTRILESPSYIRIGFTKYAAGGKAFLEKKNITVNTLAPMTMVYRENFEKDWVIALAGTEYSGDGPNGVRDIIGWLYAFSKCL